MQIIHNLWITYIKIKRNILVTFVERKDSVGIQEFFKASYILDNML